MWIAQLLVLTFEVVVDQQKPSAILNFNKLFDLEGSNCMKSLIIWLEY